MPPPPLHSMHRLPRPSPGSRAVSTPTNQLSFSHSLPDLTQVPQWVPQTSLASLPALQLSARLPPGPVLHTTTHSSLLGHFCHSSRHTDFLCPPSGSILVNTPDLPTYTFVQFTRFSLGPTTSAIVWPSLPSLQRSSRLASSPPAFPPKLWNSPTSHPTFPL